MISQCQGVEQPNAEKLFRIDLWSEKQIRTAISSLDESYTWRCTVREDQNTPSRGNDVAIQLNKLCCFPVINVHQSFHYATMEIINPFLSIDYHAIKSMNYLGKCIAFLNNFFHRLHFPYYSCWFGQQRGRTAVQMRKTVVVLIAIKKKPVLVQMKCNYHSVIRSHGWLAEKMTHRLKRFSRNFSCFNIPRNPFITITANFILLFPKITF